VFDFRTGIVGISFSLLISLLFAADIVLRFSRPFEIDGRPVVQREMVRSHYLRTWFTVDVLAAIPFGLMAVAATDGSAAESLLRLLSLLRVLRVARFFALQRQWRLRSSLNPAVLRLSFFLFWVAILAHWIACGWIALDGASSGHPELLPYQQALYWTITTLTTVGYGDITPIGRSQVSYTMVVMALGAAMYGYVIGNIASLLANIDVLRSQHLGRIEAVNNFLRDREVPRDLQAKVRDYYNYLWASRTGQQTEVLEDLPESLRIEIALHLNRHVLSKVPLFEGASEIFLRELVLRLEPVIHTPGDTIMRRGEIGNRIYFINKGTVDVLSVDEQRIIATLAGGDFFGEMALIHRRPRSNTVLAVDYCNLYALDRESFEQVLEDFPDFAAEVRRVADRRREEPDPGSS
jgi:voltage-gated potassium channel